MSTLIDFVASRQQIAALKVISKGKLSTRELASILADDFGIRMRSSSFARMAGTLVKHGLATVTREGKSNQYQITGDGKAFLDRQISFCHKLINA